MTKRTPQVFPRFGTLRWTAYPGLSGWDLERQKSQRERLGEENAEEMSRDKDAVPLLLWKRRGWFKDERPVHLTARKKWGLRSTAARNWSPPTTCKSLDADVFPDLQMRARASPARHPDFSLGDLCRIADPHKWHKKFVFLAKFVVICYGSDRKLTGRWRMNYSESPLNVHSFLETD